MQLAWSFTDWWRWWWWCRCTRPWSSTGASRAAAVGGEFTPNFTTRPSRACGGGRGGASVVWCTDAMASTPAVTWSTITKPSGSKLFHSIHNSTNSTRAWEALALQFRHKIARKFPRNVSLYMKHPHSWFSAIYLFQLGCTIYHISIIHNFYTHVRGWCFYQHKWCVGYHRAQMVPRCERRELSEDAGLGRY